MSGTWHWHRYVIPCKTISGIWHWHPTMCMTVPEYPLVFQMVQWVIQRLCQRDDKCRQASSGIEGSWSSIHTIKLIFWV
ncbi:Linear gramicidin synthase subunit C [Gossypium arboreum]|uniref:Linear gramicidin synthase subunit C n=1 Tax=Gossypium arboreum TaxID=29729 RepID=A0A0B0NAE0_GOSAR|nr:Linear gramicidin synthase subunit C [Gossypium arboreum]